MRSFRPGSVVAASRRAPRARRPAAAALGARERQFAALLWRRGELARSEIHQITGVHPTLTGNSVAKLIRAGLLREGPPRPTTERGRPQIPVMIDPDRRIFLGLSLSPGEVRIARLDPTGTPRGEEVVHRSRRSATGNDAFIRAAANALAEAVDPRVFGIGVTVTGVVDPEQQLLLFSSAIPSASPMSLAPLYEAAGGIPLVLDNDLHALSLRWLMTTDPVESEVLLVGLDDGRLGASMLINGRPQQGSVTAGNELGHMRLQVDTEPCFCGQSGCLERIVSTPQLARVGAKTDRPLDAVFADPDQDAAALATILDLLCTGLANAVNFIRPSRLVIASPLVKYPSFTDPIERILPQRILPGIRSRVQLSFWEQPCVQSAQNAAWLALADVFGQYDS